MCGGLLVRVWPLSLHKDGKTWCSQDISLMKVVKQAGQAGYTWELLSFETFWLWSTWWKMMQSVTTRHANTYTNEDLEINKSKAPLVFILCSIQPQQSTTSIKLFANNIISFSLCSAAGLPHRPLMCVRLCCYVCPTLSNTTSHDAWQHTQRIRQHHFWVVVHCLLSPY